SCSLYFLASVLFRFFFFFFFQAEDGIRDLIVTGVQTCALPISHQTLAAPIPRRPHATSESRPARVRARLRDDVPRRRRRHGDARSEERRVGKECRSRWSPDH